MLVSNATPAPCQTYSNLDLSSQEQTIQSGVSGEIQVGDAVRSIAPNDLLTPAESVALQQAVTGGQQLILNAGGAAIGGTVTVDHAINPTETLVIPAGVTLIQSIGALNLTGNLTNNGALYAAPSGSLATINANNIFNNVGAVISTVIPTSLGITSSVPVSLTLSAITDIVNAGTISSAASLTMNAGGNIINALPSGFAGAEPIMQAVNNVGINPGLQNQLGSLVNQGIIQSISGNIELANLIHNNLLVNNIQGELSARAGAINIGDSLFNGKIDTTVFGGDVFANSLNIWSGTGNTLVDVRELVGIVNIYSGGAHVHASTDSLQLGTMQLSGDPLFYNLGGSITINNAISTSGLAPLAIVASTDVLSNGGSISTSGTNGTLLFIMAGANFSVTSGTNTSETTTSAVNTSTATTITVSGLNATGNIDLSGLTADITTTGSSQPGGNVVMIAPGSIVLGSNNIVTTGDVGSNGSVVLIAGGAAGTAISGSGSITTRPTSATATATGGDILLAASMPSIQTPFTINQVGLINNGNPPGAEIYTSGGLSNASISIGNLSTGAASVVAVGGAAVTLGNIDTSSFSGAISGGPVSIVGSLVNVGTINTVGTGGGSNGTVSIIGTGAGASTITVGNITTNGNSGATGDVLLITSALSTTPIYQTNNGNLIGFQPLTTGDLLLGSISAASITTNAAPVAVIAGSITGLNSIATTATTATATAGGNVLLLATQTISQAMGTTISTAGFTGGTNGNVLIVVGTGGSVGAIDTKGPEASGGSVILLTATPSITSFVTGSQIISQGAVFAPSTAITAGNLLAGNISTNGASVIGVSNGHLTVGTVDVTSSAPIGGSVLLAAGNTVTAGGASTKGTTGRNGEFVVVAGGSAGTTISVTGLVDTAGPVADNGGRVLLLGATPDFSNFSLSNNAVTAGSTITATTIQTGLIVVGGVTTNSAPITVAGGGGVIIDGVLKTNGTLSAGLIGPGGPVGVFAGGTIVSGSSTSGIDTSGAANNFGGDVLLLAGVGITPLSLSVDAVTYASDLSLSLSGASSTGGSIDLTGGGTNNMATFTTAGAAADSGTSSGFAGGNVQIAAFGSAAGTGAITLPSSLTVITSGTTPPSPFVSFTTANQSGYVNILAGATSGTSISLGGINTTGSQAGGGSIYVTTAAPDASQFPLAYFTSNALQVVPFLTAGATQNSAVVLNGALQAAGGDRYTSPSYLIYTTSINVTAGGDMAINANITNPNNTLPSAFAPYAVTSGSPPTWPALTFVGVDSSTITLTAGGAMTFSNSPTISSNATPTTQQNPADPYAGSTGTNGGTITMSALSYTGGATVSADGTGGRYLPPTASPIPPAPPPPPAPVPAWPPSPTPADYFPLEVPNGGNGGTISITSSSAGSPVAVSSSGFTVSAKGDAPITTAFGAYTGGGNGGVVTINSGGALNIEPASFTVGPQAGANTLPTLNTQGWPNDPLNLQVQYPTGNGAIVTLTGTTVFIDGAFNVDGAASTLSGATGYPGGNGGSLYINVNSATTFNIGGATAGGNGTSGLLSASGNIVSGGATAAFGSGGTISIINTGGGISIGSGMLLVNAADATESAGAVPPPGPVAPIPGYFAGNGGQIILSGTTVQSAGSLSADGGGASARHTSGNGGSITISVNGPTFTVGTASGNGITGNLSASGAAIAIAPTGPAPTNPNLSPTGAGGTISITNLGGGISISNTASLSVAAANANTMLGSIGGTGGTITLNAAGPVTSGIALNANGGADSGTANGGFGGQITIVSNSGTSVFTTGGTGIPSLTAIGYSGGSISVQENGTGGINIGSGTILVTATSPTSGSSAGGNGGTISLTASNGPLVVNGGLDVSGFSGSNFGGNAGAITLISNSATAFLVDSTTGPGANGVGGVLSANGGTGTAGNGDAGQIFIANLGGGITVTATDLSLTAPNASTGAYAGNGGTISLCVGTSMLDPAGCGCATPATSVLGDVTITGGLNVSGGTAEVGKYSAGLGGTINILENSSSVFQIGGAGSLTGLTANGWSGGTVSVKNLGTGGVSVAPGAIQVQAGAADPTVPTNLYLNYGVRPAAGPGGTICIQCPNGPLTYSSLDASGGALFTQTATAPLNSGATQITVPSVQGFAPGQQIIVSNGTTSELATITTVDTMSNQLTLQSGLANTYGTAPSVSAYSVKTTASTVVVITGTGNVPPFGYQNSDQLQLTVADAQGFIFLQPVVISDGTNSEIQFVTEVNTAANTINVTGGATIFNASSTNLTVTAFTNSGAINLNGGTGISQSTTPSASNILRANNITLSSASGTVGTSSNPLQVEVMANSAPGTLTVNATTSHINNISNTLSLGAISTSGDFVLTSNGSITATAPINTGGALTLLNTNTLLGDINVNSQLTSGSLLTIQNNNLSGLINVGTMLGTIGNLSANEVVLTSGPLPMNLITGVAPPNVTVVNNPPFNAFFGPNGITSVDPLTIFALTGNVIFNASSPGLINFGSGSTIGATVPRAIPSVPVAPAVTPGSTPPAAIGPTLPSIALFFALPSFRTDGPLIPTDKTPIPDESAYVDGSQQLSTFTQQPLLTGKVSVLDDSPGDTAQKLPLGNSLLIADADVNVNTPFGDVLVKSGSAVMFFLTERALAILNLHDDKFDGVTFDGIGKSIGVPLGRQLVVTSSTDAQFDDINPSPIGYRELSQLAVGTNRLFLAEFSIVSALRTVIPSIKASNPDAEAIIKRLLKSAAANWLLRQKYGKSAFKASR